MSEFEDEAQGVLSRSDLARLTRDLAKDFRNHRDDWENVTTDSFLDAMSAWLESAEDLYRNFGRELADQPSWAFFAELLLAARVYE